MKLQSALQQLREGTFMEGSSVRVGAYVERWLAGVRPSLRYATWRRYRELLRLHVVPYLGGQPLQRLEPQQVEHLYALLLKQGLSTTTVHHVHAVLHRMVGAAVRHGILARNVTELVDAPQVQRKERTMLPVEGARRLLAEASDLKWRCLLMMALTTGMRQGELLGLRWDAINLDRGIVHVVCSRARSEHGFELDDVKTTSSRRLIKLGDTVVEVLRELQKDQQRRAAWEGAGKGSAFVFPNSRGKLWDAADVRSGLHALCERSGVPVMRFHDLRHAAATFLLAEGVHPKIVSEILGHSTIAITLDLYSHATLAMQNAAAVSMDRLVRSEHEGS